MIDALCMCFNGFGRLAAGNCYIHFPLYMLFASVFNAMRLVSDRFSSLVIVDGSTQLRFFLQMAVDSIVIFCGL